MGWTASAMFRQWPKAVFGAGQTADVLPAAYAGLNADSVKAALYNTTPTPDKDASLVTTGYNSAGSQWVVANEVSNGNWTSGGVALTSKASTTPSTGVFMFDAADVAPGGTVTLAGVFGTLVYDDTITVGTGGIADQGVCYNYFGGTQSVTGGTFTIVWHANGIFRITT